MKHTEILDSAIEHCKAVPNARAGFAPRSVIPLSRTRLHAELSKARSSGDALAAALMGEYSRSEALAQWAADLKLPDNVELVERLKNEGVPVDKWVRIHDATLFGVE